MSVTPQRFRTIILFYPGLHQPEFRNITPGQICHVLERLSYVTVNIHCYLNFNVGQTQTLVTQVRRW
jgi:hypothetical protein